VGKTRLVSEVLEQAKAENFSVLTGRCAEGGDPYLAFVQAFSDSTTIEEAFLIYRDGRVITHWSRKEDFSADAEVVSSMLSAIQDFISQSFTSSAGGALKEVKHGALDLIMEHAPNAYLALVVSGPRPLGIHEQMKRVLDKVQAAYGPVMDKWDGVVNRFKGVEDYLRELVTVRKYGIEQITGVREEIEAGKLQKQHAEKDRERMFENIARHITNISQERPLALFLDDLQWMDTASLHLLHYIARTTKSSQVLVMCTCRPEDYDASSPISKVLREMSRERLLTKVTLKRFQLDHVQEMISAYYRTPLANVPEDFIVKVYTETEGNPFFVEEVLKSLVDEGIVDPSSPDWYLSSTLRDIKIPSRIEDIVLRRVEKLEDTDREILTFAATIGTHFEFELLRKVSGKDEMDLADALERIVKAKLVSSDLRFDHGMIREVLYKKIPPFKLTIVHKRVGLAYEELHRKNLKEVCSALSYHFSKGNVPQKAIDYSIMAGELARTKYAHDEAINYFRTALYFIENHEDRDGPELQTRELSILTALEELCEITADLDKGMEFGRRAVTLAGLLGNNRIVAESYRSLGDIFVRTGEWEAAIVHYRKSLETAQAATDSGHSASAYRSIGNVHFRTSEYGLAIEFHSRSIAIAEKMPPGEGVPILIQTYIELGNVYTEKGDYPLAIDYYEKAMQFGIRTDSIYDVATAFNNIGDVYLKKEDYDLATEYFEKALATFKMMGTVMDIVVTLSNLGECNAKSRKIEVAKAYSDKAMEFLRRLGEVETPFQLHLNYGIIFRHMKDWDRAREHFASSISALTGVNMPYYLGGSFYEMGMMFRDQCSIKEARECFDSAVQILEKVGANEIVEKIRTELRNLGSGEPGDTGGGAGCGGPPG